MKTPPRKTFKDYLTGKSGEPPRVGPTVESWKDLIPQDLEELNPRQSATQADLEGYALDALVPMGSVAGTVRKVAEKAAMPSARELASLISDWKWRPTAQVKDELGITKLPEHVRQFGKFMEGQAQKAVTKGLSVRDVAKANAITQASIQRSALDAQNLRNIGFDIPAEVQGKIRPEGAMAELLMSPLGRNYLDQVESNAINPQTVEEMVRLMKPFGKDNDLRQKLIRNIETANLNNELTDIVGEAYTGSQAVARNQMQALTKQMHGIGPSKRGFIGSMVGYGADPTLDARQIIFQTGRPTAEAQPFLRRSSGKGAIAGVARLADRQSKLGIAVPDQLRPFGQHLVHHSIWDKVANETTTHSDLIRAMLTAGMVGGVGIGAYGAGNNGSVQRKKNDKI
jgi:hypothetical protein